MKIYAKGDGARTAKTFLQHVAPGADALGQDGPADWWDADRNPVTFPVTFRSGVAEVPDALGRFMIAKGYAKRTPLILPFGLGAAA